MTDYKQLCEELVAAWDDLPWQYNWKGDLIGINGYPPDDSAVERTRAALAEPKPEGPTDEEVDVWADDNNFVKGHGDHPCGFWVNDDDLGKIVRAALVRWGNCQGFLDSSTQPS